MGCRPELAGWLLVSCLPAPRLLTRCCCVRACVRSGNITLANAICKSSHPVAAFFHVFFKVRAPGWDVAAR